VETTSILASEVSPIRADEDFDHQRLAEHLRDKLPAADGELQVLQFPGGHSNLTYLLKFGAAEYVLRRPPLGPLAPKAHDMGREFAVLSRLYQVFPPAPRAYYFTNDPSILGAPFVVLERRRGIVIRNTWPAELGEDLALRRRISESLVDTISSLHKVDYKAIGLGDFGKPEGFLERQVKGWADRWHRAKVDEMPILDELVGWLVDTMPKSKTVALLHNDFKLDNVMLDANDPGRIVGVFDWEMATLGDPLVDLGITLSYWTYTDNTGQSPSRRITPQLWPGFLSRDEVVERYAKNTGIDVSEVDYYEAFALFKMAVVLQQIYVRYHRGQTKDERFAQLGKQVRPLVEKAREVFQKSK
jgi:aminoglycoside phosphotransferase (APT) family kinase protein